jgi:predicted kinase
MAIDDIERSAMLLMFAGLPATGKSTVAQLIARRCDATYLRIESIEQAIWTK